MERTRLTLFVLALIMPVLLLVGLATAVFPPTAHAAPQITVTTLNDSGTGSLRQAIADVDPGGTIHFSVSGTIVLANELVIGKDLTIQGNIPITISGNNATRVFNVTAGHVTFDSLTIISGTVQTTDCGQFSARCGGGIILQNSSVTVTLNNATLAYNSTSEGGSGIYNSEGTLTINNSTFAHNSGALDGGGITNESGILTVNNSTFFGNSATLGGGISTRSSGGSCAAQARTIIRNSTFSGNTANSGGAIFNNRDVIEISNSTITTNTAVSGGGVWSRNNDTTCTRIGGTIIAGNSGADVTADDTIQRFFSLGHNLIGTAGENIDFTQEFTATGDMTNTLPLLAPLADNGGPTLTHALLPDSPALDGGNCTSGPATDQRGVARPQDETCDIGAVEMQAYALTIALAGQGSGAVSSDPAGIVCGAVCELVDLGEGRVVTLTAVPSPGSTFTGWSGDLITTTNPLPVTMNNTQIITATFALAPTSSYTIYLPLVVR